MNWRRKWQPTPVFLPGESQQQGSLVAAVYGVTQSRTRLKRLSSSSSSKEIQPVHSEGDHPWDFFGRNDDKAEAPVLWLPHVKS